MSSMHRQGSCRGPVQVIVALLGLVLTAGSAQGRAAVDLPETSMPAKPHLFRSPLARAQLAHKPTLAALAGAYQALLRGDLNAFAVVAQAVLAGRALPASSAPGSPNADFFRELLQKVPAADRDAFLRLGLAGQISNSGLLGRAPRVSLSAPPAAQTLLLRYLAGFPKPQRSLDPQAPLGERLTHYTHFPQPMLVRMAGDLGLAEALPHLERFLQLKRRLYHLRTDYSTHPQEVDALFSESLRALLSIAEAKPATLPTVQAVLERLLAQAKTEERGDPMMGEGEPITLETYEDNEGTAPPTQAVRETRLPMRVGVASKSHALQQALRALAGDGQVRSELAMGPSQRRGPRLSVPGAAWTTECDDARAELSGSTLFVVTRQFVEGQHQPVLWSLDLPSGRSRFVARLLSTDPRGEESELATRGLCVDPDGSPVLLATSFRGARTRHAELLRFDPGTGEITAMLPLPAEGASDPELLACDAGGYVLRRGDVLVRLRLDGTQALRVKLGGTDRVAVGEGQIVVLGADGVRLWSGANAPASPRPLPLVDLIGQPAPPSSATPLALPNGFAIAHGRTGKLQIFDAAGRRRSEHDIPERAEPFSATAGRLAHRSLLGRDQLWVLGDDDRLLQFRVPLNVRALYVSPQAAYVADESTYSEHRLSDGTSHPLSLPGSAHMARVLAASRGWVIVLVYRDGYYLAGLPR